MPGAHVIQFIDTGIPAALLCTDMVRDGDVLCRFILP
jgi:hypothetical protein